MVYKFYIDDYRYFNIEYDGAYISNSRSFMYNDGSISYWISSDSLSINYICIGIARFYMLVGSYYVNKNNDVYKFVFINSGSIFKINKI